jgi:hypothetical protein
MYYLSPKALDGVSFFQGYIASGDDMGEARERGECDE